MNDKSNKEYAVSLFYAYTGRTKYKGNNANNDIIRMPYGPNRTLYNIYGFCLYTIQEFYDTNNRYPDLMEGTPDYIWCLNYLKGKVHNLHNNGIGLRGDLYVHINDDGKYVIDNGTVGNGDSFYIIRTISQPTNSYSHNYRI
jgi:hypothetical protein